jgi:DNA (cytosine-5)-methyltransferase 1
MRRAISLFSGAGGDTLGMEEAGYKVVAFSEMDKDAIATHRARFPDSVLLEHNGSRNIQQLPDAIFSAYTGQIDVLFAGFPCQGFSHAGKKKSDDPRNELVHEFVRATRLIQPTWIIGENVKGLLSRKGHDPVLNVSRPVIDIIVDLFRAIGYRITYKLVNTSDYGIPQLRKRLILVGHHGDKGLQWELPTLRPIPTIRSFLEDTLEDAMPLTPLDPDAVPADAERYWIPTTKHVSGEPHSNLKRLIDGVRGLTSKEREESDEKTITEPFPLLSFGRRSSGYHGEIIDPDTPSKTIICTYQSCPRLFVGMSNGHQKWIRTYTVTEMARIQGFPGDYPFRGSKKAIQTQIGNAVPPPLITHVIQSLDRIRFTEMTEKVHIEVSDTEDE